MLKSTKVKRRAMRGIDEAEDLQRTGERESADG